MDSQKHYKLQTLLITVIYGQTCVNIFSVEPSFVRATADISQSNLNGVQSQDVNGHRLDNGNFIFSWKDGSYRKMVLTKNDGTEIKHGYVTHPGTTWKDPITWKKMTIFYYSISNFKGSKGVYSFNVTSH